VRGAYPLLDDGRSLEVSNVIWCTGYARGGWQIQDGGIVGSVPGLYFVGLPFLYSLSSALLGGVGRDAKHIAEHIASRGL
jgi:putative flavoprotein involved in K+ transport